MKTVLILGGSGLLGSNIGLQLSEYFNVIKQGFSKNADIQSDLTKKSEVVELIEKSNPDVIINTVAETSVEKCEESPISAFNLNVLPIINLKRALQNLKLEPHILHISTDHMYDKSFSNEEELVFKNNYALTKFWAERELHNMKSTCLRTNFFGGDTSFKNSFSGWAQSTLLKKEPFNGFSDVYFSPLNISAYGDIIRSIVNNSIFGVYNLGSSTELSKYGFIQKVAKLYDLDGSICKPVLYKDANIKTQRPLKMSMNVSKIEKALNLTLPSLEEGISKLLD